MSVKVRMTRSGSKKRPFYRIVAINSDSRRDGRPLEFLGYYNPNTNPGTLSIDNEKLQAWVGKGAELSDTVRTLLKKLGKRHFLRGLVPVSRFGGRRVFEFKRRNIF